MPRAQKVQYRISFFEPNSEHECADFDAETPFQTVSVGDEVTGVTWAESAYPRKEPFPIARVTRVVRQLSRLDDEIHDITLVYCKSIANK
jgi:hypothetical protein